MEVLSAVSHVPEETDARKPGKDDACIIHARRGHRDRDGHAENDNGKPDPSNGDQVDQESEFS